ncbi:MAG TPA: aminoacyl-tRNA hydrolase, partial [Actinomycetota bacterium]|nr:aminoacyl-tRNA hydrolase [Actinomycetota bacterium]
MAWLIAGLGNPEDRYARTRHNLGRMVAEDLARGAGERLRKVRFLPVEVAEIRVGDERVLLARSTRFMNESGPSYASLAKKHGIEPSRLIAVHDELDIPAGTLRVKLGGGNSGHNGLRSLDHALRSPDYLRVRVGIGRPPGRQDPADFILQPVARRDEGDLALV